MDTIHTEFFKIRASEINHCKQIHPYALIQLMQEASLQHTISLKVSFWDLETIKASWVLLKMEVHFYHYPILNEEVRVETFPSGLDGFFTYRDYRMYGQNGNLYATISSMWTLMNMDTRKMMKIPSQFDLFIVKNEYSLPRPDFRLESVNSKNVSALKVNYYHLDWNGHLNNVQLIRLMLESLNDDILCKMKIKSLKLHFKAEATMGQYLNFHHVMQDNKTIRHAIFEKESNKDILYALSEWENL